MKMHRCVVRNQAYRRVGLGIRERHNERKNAGYANVDIDADRTALNIHFKLCNGSYAENFDRLEREGVISTRGLKPDAKVVDELVFDVNTAYFEKSGGYEYAKQFFKEAYRLAVLEVGGEQYILSAVMHADERNRALSEELGRDVYHYHLHVVYVPVVEKEVRWSKRCKDPALVGTTKEIIHQVSHSKKWASEKALDQNGSVIRDTNGRAVLVNAYSLLQDRYYEHMRAAGFQNFERGERGSTAQHLTVLEYKESQEIQKLNKLINAVEGKENESTALDNTIKRKKKHSAILDEQLATKQEVRSIYSELAAMGKKNLRGKIELHSDEFEKLLACAKAGLAAKGEVSDLKRQLTASNKDSDIYKRRWQELRILSQDYLEMVRKHPEETREAIEALKRLEQPVQAHTAHGKAHEQEH